MTYSSTELREQGVSEEVIAWRKWRRSMHLTIPEAAAMAGVDPMWLQRIELGDWQMGVRAKRADKLQKLMQRWQGHLPPSAAADADTSPEERTKP